MAETINVAGLASVLVGAEGVSMGSMSTLGTTQNGVTMVFDSYQENVPGDANGGDAGPPIDVQVFGETARVRCEFSKWDTTVADTIRARVSGGTAGTPPTAGSLMFQSSLSFRLLINAASSPINFLRAIPRMPIELNKGTRFSVLVIEFECHKNAAGVLWNRSTS
jgi:hypothetical protein